MRVSGGGGSCRGQSVRKLDSKVGFRMAGKSNDEEGDRYPSSQPMALLVKEDHGERGGDARH